jgi:hypothetical protein
MMADMTTIRAHVHCAFVQLRNSAGCDGRRSHSFLSVLVTSRARSRRGNAAAIEEQQKNSILVGALTNYVENGWAVHVFPWVVGIRGLLDPHQINALLEFLEIHKRHWQTAAERTVLASVHALHYMHRVRYDGSQGGQAVDRTLCTRTNTDEEDNNLDEMEAQATRKRKPASPPVRRTTVTLHTDPLRERKMRHTHLGTYQNQQRSGSTMPSKAQCPLNGGGTHQASNLGMHGNNR